MWFKRYIQKCTLSHVLNAPHDIIDLVNHQMFKNTKTWISWERYITFLRNKITLNLCLRWYILRNYRFVGEVTFKVAATDMKYFARSKFSRSLVYKRNFSLIWLVVFKLGYVFFVNRGRILLLSLSELGEKSQATVILSKFVNKL